MINVPEGIRTPDKRLRRPLLYPTELLAQRAGDGNRTHVSSLEGWCSTIELHPHKLESSKSTSLYKIYNCDTIGVTRFEPATPCCQIRYTSETVPHPEKFKVISVTQVRVYYSLTELSTLFFKFFNFFLYFFRESRENPFLPAFSAASHDDRTRDIPS